MVHEKMLLLIRYRIKAGERHLPDSHLLSFPLDGHCKAYCSRWGPPSADRPILWDNRCLLRGAPDYQGIAGSLDSSSDGVTYLND